MPNGLHKPITKKCKRHKVYLPFRDNIWYAELADMQLITVEGLRRSQSSINFKRFYMSLVVNQKNISRSGY